MASAVIALKLKCGSTLASISWMSFVRLPAWISLSPLMRSTTSSVTVFTSWSGGTSCASTLMLTASSAALARILIFVTFRSLVIVLGLLLPRRMAIVDEAAPSLQVSVSLEHVFVERRLLEDAARVEEVGSGLDEPQGDEAPMHGERLRLVQRIGIEIEPPADAVAHVARAEERQDEVRAGRRTPAAESLAEVLIVLLIAHVGGDVVEAEEADSGIKRKARPVADTVLEFSLQEIVHA